MSKAIPSITKWIAVDAEIYQNGNGPIVDGEVPTPLSSAVTGGTN